MTRSMKTRNILAYATYAVKLVGYLFITTFLLYLTYMTYVHGGKFSSWQSMIVIPALLALALLVLRLGISSIRTLSQRSF